MLCIQDFERYAAECLPNATWQFYSMGAERESTLASNSKDFEKYKFVPRVLRNLPGEKDMSVTVLGQKMTLPIGFAPTAYQKIAHHDGEIAAAKAASSMGAIYCLSSNSNVALEEVARQVGPEAVLWMQVYIMKDRQVTENMIRKAEQNGFKALVLTVDTPVVGLQLRKLRANFSLPPHLWVPNIEDAMKIDHTGNVPVTAITSRMCRTLTWDDIKWLRKISKLPVVLKGIVSVEDANLAVEHGADAVWVSNHGGRQLDGTISSIDALAGIAKALEGTNCEVYFDGGVRWGSDAFKALALGARLVFVGRPVLWGLAHSGEEGAKKILEILKKELELCMTLCGCNSLAEAKKSLLLRSPDCKI